MRARIEDDDDDPAAVDEVPLDRAHAVVGADEVRRDEVVEAVARAGLVRPADPAAATRPWIGPVRRRGAVDGAVDGRAVADVARLDVGAADSAAAVASSSSRAAREQRQPRALAREPERDRAPDPGAGAGDDDVTVLEAGVDVHGRRSLLCVSDAQAAHRFADTRRSTR